MQWLLLIAQNVQKEPKHETWGWFCSSRILDISYYKECLLHKTKLVQNLKIAFA